MMPLEGGQPSAGSPGQNDLVAGGDGGVGGQVELQNLAIGGQIMDQLSAGTEPNALGGFTPPDEMEMLAGAPPGAVDECRLSDADGDGFGTADVCPLLDCNDANPSIHPQSFEACNGEDDDCDDAVDEMLGQRSCGQGACRVLTDNCVDGALAQCVPGSPGQETCNGQDDDCDGVVDNDIAPTVCGIGACERTASCQEGQLGLCEPGLPTQEVCNDVDDDCDGVIDNAFRTQNSSVPYSELGLLHHDCAADNQRRAGHACNAAIHRFCRQQPCTRTGFGPIENSDGIAYVTCIGQVAPEDVTFQVLSQHHPACNDPDVAYSGPCFAAIHRYCRDSERVSGFGPLKVSVDALRLVCTPQGATVVHTTYTEMAAQHSLCDGVEQLWGANCNASIKRHCRNQGFESGVGPLERGPNYLSVLCFDR